jgi:transcriptional regulator GlxA family with amidase domain
MARQEGVVMEKLGVGILIFDGVEVLDFAGPFEVFSRTRLEPGVESRRSDDSAPFEVFTVAPTRRVTATGGLCIEPAYTLDDVPPIDLLVVPGGFGTRALLEHAPVIDWIGRTARAARHVTSVCTGSLLLARAGLLANRRATTHWGALDLLRGIDPTIRVEQDVRAVHDGVTTSAGVSAGIDMALDVVERLYGTAVSDDVARYMEYDRRVRHA